MDQLPNVTFEERRIIYRNFGGEPDRFNPKGGSRTYSVVLEVDEGERMAADGWNIKFPEPREEGDPPIATLKINVKYGGRGRPPRVVMVSKRPDGKLSKTDLDESTIKALDWSRIEKADMMIRAWHYDIGGQQGVAAYLVSLWATVDMDALEAKYADVPNETDFSEPIEPD